MAWQDDSLEILRVLLNDLDTTPTFDDDRLTRILLVAARQVIVEVAPPASFSVDLTAQDITPDPTDDATRDDGFMNLLTLKAASIMDRGAARIAATQGVLIKDGSSLVDLRQVLQGSIALVEKGWGAVYDQAKLEYQAGQQGVTAGAAIMTPVRWAATQADAFLPDRPGGWGDPYSLGYGRWYQSF